MRKVARYDVLVIGGGHAGAEAAWSAANLGASVAMVTMDPAKVGAMSCNPAIGGLAKGQMVREIDALGGLMGLAADATGIQFKVLNASRGPAVRGPRCQSDKYAYAREVQRLLQTRDTLDILAGTVESFIVERGRVVGVWAKLDADGNAPRETADCCGEFGAIDLAEKPVRIDAGAVVLTTGTFMRGLMHTGESKTAGGRVGEGASVGISGALRDLGFELGRLKTGTPPRLDGRTIDFTWLDEQPGDDEPVPFSDMTQAACGLAPPEATCTDGQSGATSNTGAKPQAAYARVADRFPILDQRVCHITHTTAAIHDRIRDNLDRAPMYNGQIETAGPRYCPSIEDKVVRFADRASHHVFLEPESLETDEVYCNGISTSLPADVQDYIVANLPGCERATILRHGYAVEYDMVWPHQIDATCMAKSIDGLFLAGQINGTSGYEEAAGQGLLAGLNAVRYTRGESMIRLRRDESYIGVMMDDLVTKTPREPYRMFTSRAEFRLLLRADNADERLTPLGRDWGLVDDARWDVFNARADAMRALRDHLSQQRHNGASLLDFIKRPETTTEWVLSQLNGAALPAASRDPRLVARLIADVQYAGYIDRQRRDVEKLKQQETTPLPPTFDYEGVEGLRREAQHVLSKFKPTTLGQAARLAGITPADLMIVTVAMGR